MPGLVPGIHVLRARSQGVDGRDKPGHDDADAPVGSEPAHGSPTLRHMDAYTRLLLGVTALAVLGYIGMVYGGCAADPDCHFRVCAGGRAFCGVVYGPAGDLRAP